MLRSRGSRAHFRVKGLASGGSMAEPHPGARSGGRTSAQGLAPIAALGPSAAHPPGVAPFHSTQWREPTRVGAISLDPMARTHPRLRHFTRPNGETRLQGETEPQGQDQL